mmetsp:Transcript_43301/g.83118  ORF Transcript_43301/g.83118 Transcript_43301/m.83118 type:complete len:141 (-) Transcript_43301:267-689(-)
MKAVVPGGPCAEARGDQPAVGGTLVVEVGGNGGDKALCMEAGATELGGMELPIEPGSIVRGGNAALAGIVPACIIVPGGKDALRVEPGGIIEPGGRETPEPGGIIPGGNEPDRIDPGGFAKVGIDAWGIVGGGPKLLCIV